MGWIMLFGLVYWCMSGLGSDKQTAVKRYSIDVSGLGKGEARAFSVGNQPLIVVHRSQSQIETLSEQGLNDASSWQNTDPAGVNADHRGNQAAWIVIEALGTALSCPVVVKHAGGEFQGAAWLGGFADRCRDQRYDWAGRVYAGQDAKRNLRVMAYQLSKNNRLSIELQ